MRAHPDTHSASHGEALATVEGDFVRIDPPLDMAAPFGTRRVMPGTSGVRE